jgi:hypothetical protein
MCGEGALVISTQSTVKAIVAAVATVVETIGKGCCSRTDI